MTNLQDTGYPVRTGVDVIHKFNEIATKVESVKALAGPIFTLEQRNHAFNKIEQRLQERNLMNGERLLNYLSHRFKSLSLIHEVLCCR